MAEARRTKTKITKEIPAIQLTVTEGEADFLIAVLAKVGGSPVDSPRKYSDSIQRALIAATGFSYPATDAYPLMSEFRSGIYFNEYPASTGRRYA